MEFFGTPVFSRAVNFREYSKRILEDYVTATKYIKEILDEIEKEVMKGFETE